MCPLCGSHKIFDGYIRLKENCSNCLFSIKNDDIGDAAAWFSMFITGILVSFGALFLELSFQPELWLHIMVWVPTVFIIVFITLRPVKLLFIYLNYKNRKLD